MAFKPFNGANGFSVGQSTPISIADANGNITANGITVSAKSNLGPIGNVIITGGSSGQAITTDGAGNLTFTTVGGSGTLSNGTSNIQVLNNANITFSSTGNANIMVVTGTGVNVAGTLNATGNANAGNFGTAQVLASANVTSPQLISNVSTGTAPLVVSSTTLVSNLNADLLDGLNSATANTASTIVARDANGNVSANFFIGNGSQLTGLNTSTISNGNSNVSIPAANGNVNISAVGNANIVVVTGTGVNVAGTLNATGNANVGNLGASQVLASANVTAPQLISNVTTGTAPLVVTSTTQVANLNAATAGTATSATTAGTVTTAAQPNITSVGTLTDLNVNGNAVIGGNLAINGNLTYLNVETLAIEDPIINLQTGANGAAPVANSGKDVGSALNYYDTQARIAFMGWDVSNVEFGLASQASITNEVVTFTTYGNLRVGNIIGNGQALTGLAGGNVTGAVAFATTANAVAGANVSGQVGNALVAGTVYTNAQPNITSVGTLTSVAVTGNATVGNVYANTGTVGASLLTGTLTTGAQPNISSVGTLANLSVTSNVTAGNLVGTFANGNSNIAIPAANGNINISAGGTPNELVITNTGINVAGTLNATGNANVGNLGTAQVLASANVTAPQLISNVAVGTAPFVVTSTTQVANLSVATAGSATTAGTVTTAAQPNITSVGTLTSLVVSGTSNLGPVGNVTITGGSAGQYLQTNGSGVLSWQSISAGTSITNGNSNVSIPTANGNVNISAVGNANVVVVTGTGVNVAGTLNTGTGNANVGNLGTAQVLASANVTAPQLISNITDGTAPLIVTSTTLVPNLHVARANVADNINVAAGSGNNFLIFANAATGNVAELTSTGLIANLSNNSITATTFVGSLSGAATTAGTVTTAAQPNITSVGTLTLLNSSGTITAPAFTANTGVFTGNGNGLSSIVGANVTGQVGNALVAGTVYTAAQPNITSVGTLTALGVSGNITAANITANTGVFTGNGNGLSSIVGANVTGTVASATAATNASALLQNTSTSTTVYPTFTASSANGNSGALINTAISANLGNASITATTFVGALSGAASSATTAGTVTTAAQPNITSVGTLTSLGVTGNVTAGNVYANAGTIGALLLTGTLTTAAQPNVTSVGTLSALTVTGNIAGGNLTTAGVLSVTGTGVSSIAGNLDMTSNTIINLATPTNASDAATKQYVDDVAQGLHTHDSCNAATQTTLATISGGTVTYNNGTAGVGATLTTTGTYTTIDGVTLSNGMRILVKNEANTAHNGIYDRTSTTVLTRSSDFDTPTEMAGGDFTFVTAGTVYDNTGWVMTDPVTTVGTSPVVWVQFSGAGAYTAGTGLTLTGTQFSITNTAVSAGSYGNGDSVATFTVNAQGQLTAASNVAIAANAANLSGTALKSTVVTSSLTSVGTLGSLAVTGNTTSGNFIGVFANGNSNVNIPAANGNVNISAVGTANVLVVTATGANITGTLNTGTGNANVGNLGTATAIITTGNITTINSGLLQNGTSNVVVTAAGGNVTLGVAGTTRITATSAGANVTGTLDVSGNATAGNVYANAGTIGASLLTGTLTTAAQPNITSLGTLSAATITTGNITTINSGLLQNGNSNIAITANGNINITAAGGTPELVITSSGANINGVTYANGSVNINNVFSLFSNTASLSTVSQTAIDSFTANTAGFGSAKYVIQAFDTVAGVRQISEVLVTANTTAAVATEYAIISTSGTPIATFDVSYASNAVSLLATGLSANATQYKVTRQAIAW